MKIFITGVAGQVGSHVAEILLERGDEILGIDNFATGRSEHLPVHDKFEFVEDTISDKNLIDRLISSFSPDVVVHTAASYKDPDDWYTDTLVNSAGGVNLINATKNLGKARFIYFQTALCYGLSPQENPVLLGHPKDPSNSSYAISKTVTEDYLTLSGIDYVTFRLANVIGPRNVSGPLPIFYSRLSHNKNCFVTTARRDFVFVKDLSKFVVKAIDGLGQGAYHFSSGTDVAIKELYDCVVNAMGLQENYPEPEVRPLGEDEAASILLDPTRTFDDFGAVDFTSLQDTVSAAIEYYKKFGVFGEITHLKISK